ncbi:MAG: zinc ribbon domain-containing protein [Methanospirillum sp.]
MTNETAFTIPPGLLPWLGSLGTGGEGPLSPFLAGEVRPPDTAEKERLHAGGVIVARGGAAARIRPTLGALANPAAAVAVRLSSGEEYYEHTAFLSADGTRSVLLTTVGSEVLVRDPAPVEEILEGVRQYVGDSVLRAPRFEAELDPEEALALAAVVDLHRRALFGAYAGDTPFTRPILGPAKIAAAAESTTNGLQWLVDVVKLVGGADRLTPAALDRLVRSGHLRKEKGGFALADEAALLAERLLVVESVLALEAVRAEPGTTTLQRLNLLCLQAGIHDLLSIESVAGRLRFECLSGAAVLVYLRHLLTEPGALAPGEETAIACPSCGEPAQAGTKFCRKCGTALPLP